MPSFLDDIRVRLAFELTTCQVLKDVFSRNSDLELRRAAFETLNKRMEEIDNALLCLQRSRE